MSTGAYRIKIKAEDAKVGPITRETFSAARLDSVLFPDGQAQFGLASGQEVVPEQVIELRLVFSPTS